MGVMWTGIINPKSESVSLKDSGGTHQSHQTQIVQWDYIWNMDEGGLGEKILVGCMLGQWKQ